MMDLAVQFDNASAAKEYLTQAYEKCNDISQETRNLIDTFLKRESDKDYEINLAMYRKAGKIKKQIEAKYDEEVLREILKEQATAEKEWGIELRKKKLNRFNPQWPNTWLRMHQVKSSLLVTNSRPVLEQYNELFGILGRFTQHKMNMDESIQVSCIIDKLPPSWKDFKHTLKHLKDELTLVESGSLLRIEESLRAQDNDKPKGNNVVDPLVFNMVEYNNSRLNIVNDNIGSAFMSTSKLNDLILWHARLGHVHFKRMQYMSKDGLILAFDMDTEKCKTCMLNKITKKLFQHVKRETEVFELIHSDLCDLHATPLFGNKKFFVTFIDDASRMLLSGKKQLMMRWISSWVLADLPPGCKPLGCKWIFKRKLKYHMTADYYGINHNLIIHQMNVKTAFLNGELEKEVYMNKPHGFIMPGNENKVYKLIKSLYGLKQAHKQWHQKFDEVVLSNGYLLNQADKCVYNKFDEFSKRVTICLYVDDMLIFGTNQVQVDLTKELLSSRFSMKDMGEADVILGIRIKHESNGIAISQSHYFRRY
nr:zinc finger, CCHC-type [Tanacetum cinerariifolium]